MNDISKQKTRKIWKHIRMNSNFYNNWIQFLPLLLDVNNIFYESKNYTVERTTQISDAIILMAYWSYIDGWKIKE